MLDGEPNSHRPVVLLTVLGHGFSWPPPRYCFRQVGATHRRNLRPIRKSGGQGTGRRTFRAEDRRLGTALMFSFERSAET